MGLSGRKVKQRIPADPRNLGWADDAAKFGQNYLSKLGWDPSKGLGVAGDGRTSHIKVAQKLDMLGIGAAQQKDPNGIAWKQNKDFENVLKRLNESAAAAAQEAGNGNDGVANETEMAMKGEGVEDGGEISEESRLEKKRKKSGDGEGDDERKARKKRKKSQDNEAHKKEKDKKKDETNAGPSPVTHVPPEAPSTATVHISSPRPLRHRGHRARVIASKQLASKSATAISEILGIAPTPSSSTPSTSSTPHGTLTPLDDTVTLEKLTTSTKSVADYFKERLLAKSSRSGTAIPPGSVTEGNQDIVSSSYDVPRGGLGSSRLRVEITESDAGTEPPSFGLGATKKFSSFLATTSLSPSQPPTSTAALEATLETPAMPSGDPTEDKRDRKKSKFRSNSTGEKEEEHAAERKKSKEKRLKNEKHIPAHNELQQINDEVTEKKRAKEARKREKAERKAKKRGNETAS